MVGSEVMMNLPDSPGVCVTSTSATPSKGPSAKLWAQAPRPAQSWKYFTPLCYYNKYIICSCNLRDFEDEKFDSNTWCAKKYLFDWSACWAPGGIEFHHPFTWSHLSKKRINKIWSTQYPVHYAWTKFWGSELPNSIVEFGSKGE